MNNMHLLQHLHFSPYKRFRFPRVSRLGSVASSNSGNGTWYDAPESMQGGKKRKRRSSSVADVHPAADVPVVVVVGTQDTKNLFI